MKATYALLVAVAAGGAALLSAAAVVRSFEGAGGEEALTGLWTVEPATRKAASPPGPLVQLTLSRRTGAHGHSNHSSPVALAELRGLTAEKMSAGTAVVSFTLERDAGSFAFDGSVRRVKDRRGPVSVDRLVEMWVHGVEP